MSRVVTVSFLWPPAPIGSVCADHPSESSLGANPRGLLERRQSKGERGERGGGRRDILPRPALRPTSTMPALGISRAKLYGDAEDGLDEHILPC